MEKSLEVFLTDQPKFSLLKIKVVSQVKANVFIIADGSGHSILTGDGKFLAELVKESSYMIMLPKVDTTNNIVVVTQKAKPIKKDIVAKKISKENFEKLTKKAEQIKFESATFAKETSGSTSTSEGPTKSIQDHEALKPNTKINKMVLKAVFKSPIKNKRSQTMRFKDANSDSISCNLQGRLVDKCEVDKIYTVQNITRSDFKGPSDKFHRFNTRDGITRFSEHDDKEGIFDKILIADDVVTGTIVQISYKNFYDACSSCNSKVMIDAEHCGKEYCRQKVSRDTVITDFNYTLEVLPKDGTELVSLFGFKRHLQIEDQTVKTSEDMDAILENIIGYDVKVDYNIDYTKTQNSIERLTILN